mmetsp:Transcript_65539/g.114034  ORF Transcript_65539/g.114034 Transcript_65539/m.114034 type:complete len:218 (-) Transcript_65539:70-723(-)
MRKLATVFALVACAGEARRVQQDAAFNPSLLGTRTPMDNPARASPALMGYPEIEVPKDIMSTLPDLEGPAIVEMNMDRQLEHKGFDAVDLFMQALQTTGVGNELKGPGPFTLFLPVNSEVEGFTAMGGSLTEDILKNHIFPGTITKGELAEGRELTMLSGKVCKTGPEEFGSGVEIAGVTVPGLYNPSSPRDGGNEAFPWDVPCTNGLIHGIRGVIE